MNHKLYKIKTKIQQKIPLRSRNKVSAVRQTVTPNKDVVGVKEVLKQKRGGRGGNVIHSGGGVGVVR